MAETFGELHRLQPMKDYNEALFNKMYKIAYPLIKKLSRNVDARRYNVTPDIIQSYFVDKLIFVFNKYQDIYDEERLKATILSSLSTFKCKLLRKAYTEQADYFQSLSKLDDLFEDSKELIDDSEEERLKEDRIELIDEYMKLHLSDDAYLLFQVLMTPPEYIIQRATSTSKISNVVFLDFFGCPRTKTYYNYISNLRKEILYFTEKAKLDLPH